MRKIIVYSTVGSVKKTYETEVTTWGELKDMIIADFEDIQLNKMNAMDNVNKTSFEHPEAILPAKDFTLFLHVKDTDKGAEWSMVDLRAKITELKVTYGSEFTSYIGNYTRQPKVNTISLVEAFIKSKSEETSTTTKEEKLAPVVKSVIENTISTAEESPLEYIKNTMKELQNCFQLSLKAIDSMENALASVEITVKQKEQINQEIDALKIEAAKLLSFKY